MGWVKQARVRAGKEHCTLPPLQIALPALPQPRTVPYGLHAMRGLSVQEGSVARGTVLL